MIHACSTTPMPPPLPTRCPTIGTRHRAAVDFLFRTLPHVLDHKYTTYKHTNESSTQAHASRGHVHDCLRARQWRHRLLGRESQYGRGRRAHGVAQKSNPQGYTHTLICKCCAQHWPTEGGDLLLVKQGESRCILISSGVSPSEKMYARFRPCDAKLGSGILTVAAAAAPPPPPGATVSHWYDPKQVRVCLVGPPPTSTPPPTAATPPRACAAPCLRVPRRVAQSTH